MWKLIDGVATWMAPSGVMGYLALNSPMFTLAGKNREEFNSFGA